MDASTKLAPFSLEEEVLTEYIPKHMSNFVGYNFNILGGLFGIAYIAISLRQDYILLLFKFLFRPFKSSPGASNSDLLYEK